MTTRTTCSMWVQKLAMIELASSLLHKIEHNRHTSTSNTNKKHVSICLKGIDSNDKIDSNRTLTSYQYQHHNQVISIMNDKGDGNSSLLKSNNPRKHSNTKPSVSFATTASVRTVPHRNANDECSQSSSSSIPRSKGKGTSPYLRKAMNDEEDDAFDPKSFSSSNTNISAQDAEKNRIREAKAQRALKRMTDEDSYFNGDHDVSGSNIQMEVGDARRGVQGEEEVDDRYSLLALQDQELEHEQKEKQKRQDENESENGFGIKNENSISGNIDTGTSKHQEACPIEPFNMTSEREDGEGYFDGDTYVFRRGRGGNDEDDAWLDQFQENEDAYKGNENKIQGGDDSATGSTSTSTSTSTFMNLPKLKANKLQSKDENKHIQTQSALASKSEQDQLTTKEQVYDRLLPLLASDSETVLQALGRYGTIMKREKKQKAAKRNRNRNRNTNTNSDSNSTNKSKEPQENASASASASSSVSASAIALNRLTELSSLCMMKFDDGNIYERSRGSLQLLLDKSDREANVSRKRSYFESDSNASTCSAGVNVNVNKNKNNTNGHGDKRPRGDGGADATTTATATDANANASAGTPHKNGNVQWEYRGNQDNVIHGPYTTQQMLEWTKAGYFIGAAAVDIRMVMGANKVNISVSDAEGKGKQEVVDDLLGDLEDSDDENEIANNEDGADTGEVLWQKSDQVDFASFL